MSSEEIPNYDKPAYITLYNGIYFRSMLEATWASLLDELVHDWVYEPKEYDSTFKGWLPDFAMYPSNRDRIPVLCEVKPLDLKELPLMVTAKIEASEQADNDFPVVILGKQAPVWCQVSAVPLNNLTAMGWVSYRRRGGKRDWKPLPLTLFIRLVKPELITGNERDLIQLIRSTWESKEKSIKSRPRTIQESLLTSMSWNLKDIRKDTST